MKNAFAFLAFFLLTVHQMQAQDLVLLNRIKDTNGKTQCFEADVANTMVKPKTTLTQEGKLYYVKPYEYAALFTNGKYIIANEKKIKMDIGMFHGTFKLREGGMMQSISRIFLYGIQGRTQDLADENGYALTTQTEDDCHIITATIIKKNFFGIGYKTVVFKYHTDSLLLKEIVLYDYNSVQDTYTISNITCDVPIDKETFQF